MRMGRFCRDMAERFPPLSERQVRNVIRLSEMGCSPESVAEQIGVEVDVVDELVAEYYTVFFLGMA